MELIGAAGVKKSFGERQVLADCSISVKAGEVVLLLGPSGYGKSTFLEILAGIGQPDSGSVRVQGEASFLFQDDALIPWLTAAGNLSYVLPRGWSRKTRADGISRWLSLFSLDEDDKPPLMSGGMRRRLSLARTFILERPVLILDEPFAFLDRHWHSQVASLLNGEAEKGRCAILAGHSVNPELLEECGKRLRVLPLKESPLSIPADLGREADASAGDAERPRSLRKEGEDDGGSG
ncbi:MAG: ATP-binding cassette domain-containing protein [Deltaproteobacteria bacterium]|jgi:ABC-type nitrate/sulfonate/bicarbonate transport system ATPase subunit|nr:ATP-binding cassette domain-containing protein [Deltaproteobacteria bacterium]